MTRHLRRIISKFLLGALATFVTLQGSPNALGAAPEDSNWEAMSAQLAGVDGRIDAFARVGNHLYAGGRFQIIGGLVTDGIASWDGTRWSALGTGINGGVAALHTNGTSLIVGGSFASAGGVAAINVARWDGLKWNALGSLSTQPVGEVQALAELNGEIYAGGNFQAASGAAANYLARWNGAQWRPVGSGVDGTVYALHRIDDALYAGGAFTNAGGKAVNGIARWDGLKWESLEQGVRGGLHAIYALSSIETNLYVGGDFAEVSGDSWFAARGLARWTVDGSRSKWSSLNVGQVSVRALRGFEKRLFVGGRFAGIGAATSRNVAELSPAKDWISFGAGVSSGNLSDIAAIEPFGSDIFCGGFFEMAGTERIPDLARWTGVNWLPAGGGVDLGLNQGSQQVKAVGSRVYVLGTFNRAGPASVRGAAEWTGAGWRAMGNGVPQWTQFQQANATTDGRDLYVSMAAGLNSTKFVHRWDGAAWIPVGEAGPQGPVAVSGADIFAAGTFAQGYGVAKLEGARWTGLGTAFRPGLIRGLAVSGPNVYAAGGFSMVGGEAIDTVARWDEVKWQKLGTGFPAVATSGINALAVSGDRLYAGPGGNSRANLLYVWNGSAWSTLPGTFSATNRGVFISSIVPEGSDLYVGGTFDRIDDLTVNNIARWDGTRWHALGSGVGTGNNASILSLAVTAERVYAVGTFTTAGGKGSRYFAIWHKKAAEPEIIVNSTGDEPDADLTDNLPDVDLKKDGLQTTLRCAIDFANRRAGKDVIKFEIKPEDNVFKDGVPLIRPRTNLPEIIDPVVIDGWSQNPISNKPAVGLSGRLIPRPEFPGTRDLLDWPGAANGLDINASDCEIRGLIVVHFPLCGILLRGPGNHIYGNYIGLAKQGSLPAANGLAGSVLYDTALGTSYPAHIRGAGICILASGNLIGGSTLRDRNVIFGRTGTVDEDSGEIDYYRSVGPPEIIIRGPTASLNRVQGNILGLDPAGARVADIAPPPDPSDHYFSRPLYSYAGIRIEQGASENLIGGNTPENGNVIAGAGTAVVVEDSPNDTVSGNVIGKDASEKNEGGISSIRSPGTLIGGDLPSSGNVIANFLIGISVSGSAGSPCIVRNNQIGISSAGLPLGGYIGIHVSKGAWLIVEDNTIAHNGFGLEFSDDPGVCRITNNVIRDNEQAGVFFIAVQAVNDILFLCNTIKNNGTRVVAFFSTYLGGVVIEKGGRITLRENSIFNNGGLGIRLGTRNGPLLDDIGDLDSGPNTLLNFPILFPVRLTDGVINGRLTTSQSLSVRTYRVELFASARASSTGYGEAERFLGAVDVAIGITGENTFTFPIPSGVTNGSFITATATDPDGNTSEFSKAVQACSGTDGDFDGICDELEAGVPGRPAPAPLFVAGSARASRALLGASPNNPVPGSTTDSGGALESTREARVLPQNAPATGDGNGDGIADAQQANVASVLGIAGKWLTLAAANGPTLKNVEPSGPPDFNSLPSGYSFPLGFVSLTLAELAPGGTVTVTNILHDAVDLTTVFAYGPSSGNVQPHWYELIPIFSGDELRLTFTDGATGDHDLAANGAITTIYAPAYRIPSGPTLTLLSYKTSLERSLDVIEVNGIAKLTTNQVAVVTSVLAWPAAATNWFLQFTDKLSPTNLWRTEFGSPAVWNNQNVVTNTATGLTRYYRLRAH